MKNYKKTLRACYLGLITQAIAANFAPLLFLTFHSDFNISLGQIALIPAVFYVKLALAFTKKTVKRWFICRVRRMSCTQ